MLRDPNALLVMVLESFVKYMEVNMGTKII